MAAAGGPVLVLSRLARRGLAPVSGLFAHALEVFQVDAASIASRAIAKARPGAVIIFHDGYNARGGVGVETVDGRGQVGGWTA